MSSCRFFLLLTLLLLTSGTGMLEAQMAKVKENEMSDAIMERIEDIIQSCEDPDTQRKMTKVKLNKQIPVKEKMDLVKKLYKKMKLNMQHTPEPAAPEASQLREEVHASHKTPPSLTPAVYSSAPPTKSFPRKREIPTIDLQEFRETQVPESEIPEDPKHPLQKAWSFVRGLWAPPPPPPEDPFFKLEPLEPILNEREARAVDGWEEMVWNAVELMRFEEEKEWEREQDLAEEEREKRREAARAKWGEMAQNFAKVFKKKAKKKAKEIGKLKVAEAEEKKQKEEEEVLQAAEAAEEALMLKKKVEEEAQLNRFQPETFVGKGLDKLQGVLGVKQWRALRNWEKMVGAAQLQKPVLDAWADMFEGLMEREEELREVREMEKMQLEQAAEERMMKLAAGAARRRRKGIWRRILALPRLLGLPLWHVENKWKRLGIKAMERVKKKQMLKELENKLKQVKAEKVEETLKAVEKVFDKQAKAQIQIVRLEMMRQKLAKDVKKKLKAEAGEGEEKERPLMHLRKKREEAREGWFQRFFGGVTGEERKIMTKQDEKVLDKLDFDLIVRFVIADLRGLKMNVEENFELVQLDVIEKMGVPILKKYISKKRVEQKKWREQRGIPAPKKGRPRKKKKVQAKQASLDVDPRLVEKMEKIDIRYIKLYLDSVRQGIKPKSSKPHKQAIFDALNKIDRKDIRAYYKWKTEGGQEEEEKVEIDEETRKKLGGFDLKFLQKFLKAAESGKVPHSSDPIVQDKIDRLVAIDDYQKKIRYFLQNPEGGLEATQRKFVLEEVDVVLLRKYVKVRKMDGKRATSGDPEVQKILDKLDKIDLPLLVTLLAEKEKLHKIEEEKKKPPKLTPEVEEKLKKRPLKFLKKFVKTVEAGGDPQPQVRNDWDPSHPQGDEKRWIFKIYEDLKNMDLRLIKKFIKKQEGEEDEEEDGFFKRTWKKIMRIWREEEEDGLDFRVVQDDQKPPPTDKDINLLTVKVVRQYVKRKNEQRNLPEKDAIVSDFKDVRIQIDILERMKETEVRVHLLKLEQELNKDGGNLMNLLNALEPDAIKRFLDYKKKGKDPTSSRSHVQFQYEVMETLEVEDLKDRLERLREEADEMKQEAEGRGREEKVEDEATKKKRLENGPDGIDEDAIFSWLKLLNQEFLKKAFQAFQAGRKLKTSNREERKALRHLERMNVKTIEEYFRSKERSERVSWLSSFVSGTRGGNEEEKKLKRLDKIPLSFLEKFLIKTRNGGAIPNVKSSQKQFVDLLKSFSRDELKKYFLKRKERGEDEDEEEEEFSFFSRRNEDDDEESLPGRWGDWIKPAKFDEEDVDDQILEQLDPALIEEFLQARAAGNKPKAKKPKDQKQFDRMKNMDVRKLKQHLERLNRQGEDEEGGRRLPTLGGGVKGLKPVVKFAHKMQRIIRRVALEDVEKVAERNRLKGQRERQWFRRRGPMEMLRDWGKDRVESGLDLMVSSIQSSRGSFGLVERTISADSFSSSLQGMKDDSRVSYSSLRGQVGGKAWENISGLAVQNQGRGTSSLVPREHRGVIGG